jgi:nucleotide-binding universal stress UspA family protein
MSGVILALMEHPESALTTLAAARAVAGLLGGARINALAIRLPPETAVMPSEEVLTQHQATDLRAREQARVAALRAGFEVWAAAARAPGIATEWAEIEGPAETLVSEWGRRSDYIVLSRPGARGSAAERMEVQAALFDTDRPVLVVPPGPAAAPVLPLGQRVAIAWRDDRRTVRSVLGALRLFSAATEVHVLAGVRDGAPEPVLPAILAEHGFAAKVHVLPIRPPVGPDAHARADAGVFGERLLAEVHSLGVDLLVMGAFAHSRWRELLLGGVTRHVLAHAGLPVLMRH